MIIKKFKIILFVLLGVFFVAHRGSGLVYAVQDSKETPKQDVYDADHGMGALKQEIADLQTEIDQGQKDQQHQSEQIHQLEDVSQ